MIKDSKNKMQTNEADKSQVLTDFFYPEHGITIQAPSQEEADNQLREKIKKDNNNVNDHE